jgi:predicted small metal-binding protein
MKSVSCRDAGFDCDYTAEGDSDNELFTKGEKHVFNVHGMKKEDVISMFNERMRSSIKET